MAEHAQGTEVVVIASGVTERWLSHAYLADLVSTFQGKPTTGDPLCWMRLLAAGGGADILRAIEQQLVHADNLPLPDALTREQELLQHFAAMPGTQARLGVAQAGYHAGETMEQLLG